jgi:hypothetical protein
MWQRLAVDSERDYRALTKGLPLVIVFVVVVAGVFHYFVSDAFPWIGPLAVGLGLLIWVAYALFCRSVAQWARQKAKRTVDNS